MLTKEYLKDHFLDAYFIDNERENVEVQMTSEDNKQIFTQIVPFNYEHEGFKALQDVMSVDELHERTYNKKKEEKKLFEEQVINIAKKDGLVFDEMKLDTKFYPTLVKSIVEEQDNEDHLFALKLALFEVDKIKDAKDVELKSNIRKGKTKVEVLLNALKLISEESN
tara:strand:- start:126 stop:626 length:501 start_codon:yes stop_codon:yes gene_type:complete